MPILKRLAIFQNPEVFFKSVEQRLVLMCVEIKEGKRRFYLPLRISLHQNAIYSSHIVRSSIANMNR